ASRAARHDVVLLTRGGGSLEDLWAFNDEAVARAIRASVIPVVSAIGHEVDFTIADFAADLRAPTPSAAAELLVPDAAELIATLRRQAARLAQFQRRMLELRAQRLDHLLARLNAQRPQARLLRAEDRLRQLHRRLSSGARANVDRSDSRLALLRTRMLAQHPLARLERGAERARALRGRLDVGMRAGIEQRRSRLAELARTLHAVSPLATLERGYAILTERETGRVVRSSAQVRVGMKMQARVCDGLIPLHVAEHGDLP
ncbi:MAG TPA: exodeoxyribonuclease VII large subunit, partial [Dokdonella sp.]